MNRISFDTLTLSEKVLCWVWGSNEAFEYGMKIAFWIMGE